MKLRGYVAINAGAGLWVATFSFLTKITVVPVSISSTAPAGRIEWIDVVKGLAISLVVYGHVAQGAVASGMLASTYLFNFLNAFVYSFHMPAFFFISGLFAARRLHPPIENYLRDKAATIAWPYLVWTPLSLLVYSLFSRYYNHPMGDPLHSLLTILWNPGESWFLHALFCVEVIMIIAVWVRIEIVFGLSILGFFLSGFVGIPPVARPLFFLPFFVAGVWASSRIHAVPQAFIRLALAAILLFLFQAVLVASPAGGWPASLLILGFTGTFGLIALAQMSSGTWFAKWFARIGAASLGVFLMHPYVQGAVRAILQKLIPNQHGLSIALQIIAAILVPVFLYELLMSGPGRYLFTLKPKRKKSAAD